ncbi:hypothetical protein BASA50_006911 [Batrachochytrium salamandrivorans]|uniref:Kinesin motor domain-containing protein n=1 Tax=Batrachochytrium salamandrivorans TaxID=1357716 RepID=A0ABQ8FBL6_9FUNG|nr:hypothetical protein BASA50_006911 [Batrachochytrium salamandrivorans]
MEASSRSIHRSDCGNSYKATSPTTDGSSASTTNSRSHLAAVLTPARVAVLLHGDHRGIAVTNSDIRYLMLSDPFASNSSKKYYLDHCFKGASLSAKDIGPQLNLRSLARDAVQGKCSAIITSRIGQVRAASISRLSIHLQAIEQLSNMLQDNISEPPPISKPILSMVYVAFTDTKCIDMVTEETVRLGSATLADHSRTMESAEEIIKVVSKGCSLPFLISIKIETTRGVDNRTEGNLLLIDFGSPSFQNLPDRSPASLPHTLSIIRELASLIVTPGAAGELPILQSPFTSLVPELFGGSAISLYILNVDVSDPSCNATDVQPALELYDSMRKIRNQTNVKRVDLRILSLEAEMASAKERIGVLNQLSRESAAKAEVDKQGYVSEIASICTSLEAVVDANAQQGLDMNGMKRIMSIGKAATNASYRVESAIKDEMLRQEKTRTVLLHHENERTKLALRAEEESRAKLVSELNSLNKSKDDFSTELTETFDLLSHHSSRLALLEDEYTDHVTRSDQQLLQAHDHISELETMRVQLEKDLGAAVTLRNKNELEHQTLATELLDSANLQSQTISRCKDLEAQLEWAKLDHSKAAEALSQLQSDLVLRTENAQRVLAQAQSAWMVERTQLLANLEASNHMEDKWNSRLQQSILTLEAKAKEAASNRVNEVELLKETLDAARREQQVFVQAALEQERAEWNDQKSALLALIASKATENASEAAQKVPHLPLSERSGEAVPILTPADSEPIAKSDSKKVSKKSTTKTTSKEVISKDKNLKSAAKSSKRVTKRPENYSAAIDTEAALLTPSSLKSTDSLERNSDGESSFDISIDEDISVELVSAPKKRQPRKRKLLGDIKSDTQPSEVLNEVESKIVAEESLAKTDVDDADTGVAVDKREVLKPVTTTKSGANSKRKPNIKAKSDSSVEIAHNPAKSSKKRKMSSGTLKPSEAPENGGDSLLCKPEQPAVSLSGLLSFLSKGKENDAVSDSSTAGPPIAAAVPAVLRLPKHFIDQRRLAILNGRSAS